ncbi:MAG: glycosyltransferase, partial [Bacteroidota bacterium]|nr:glycosyltransferase [Bacteroidota bacterium]
MLHTKDVLISICIPTFSRVAYFERLLASIKNQTFTSFEVIVSDDSPGDEIKKLCEKYALLFSLKYYKNITPLGTPENWNEAMRRATGQWIKIMHDDDWFAEDDSLLLFKKAIDRNPRSEFIFSAYYNIYEKKSRQQLVLANPLRWNILLKEPVTLLARNIIGPPSVTLHKNNKQFWYDSKVKWVVDIEFYIRYFLIYKPIYIKNPLINVGINDTQVTTYTFGVAEVHLKESLYLLNKTGEHHLKNILVFDAWWRLLRNFSIRNIEQIRSVGYDGEVPNIIYDIIRFQNKIPVSLLIKGVTSKMFMLVCYLFNKRNICIQ